MVKNKNNKLIFVMVAYLASVQTQLSDLFEFYYTIKR